MLFFFLGVWDAEYGFEMKGSGCVGLFCGEVKEVAY